MKNAERPAYPTELAFYKGEALERHQTSEHTGVFPGLTKRELIAAMALQGMLSGTDDENTFSGNQSWYAQHAVKFADELLKQLEK